MTRHRDSKGALTWARFAVLLAVTLAAVVDGLLVSVSTPVRAVAISLLFLTGAVLWYLEDRPRFAWLTRRLTRRRAAVLLALAAAGVVAALAAGDTNRPPGVPQRASSPLAIAPGGGYTVGAAGTASGAPGAVTMRVREDGSLDPGFGRRGIAFHRVGAGHVSVDSILAGEDGRIAIAGTATPSQGGRVAYLGRLRADGSAERGFYSETEVAGRSRALVQGLDSERLLLGVTNWLRYEPTADDAGRALENSFALLAHDASGVLDLPYGDDGAAYVPIECGRRLRIPCRPLSALLLHDDGEAVTAAAQISTVDRDGDPGPTSAGPVFDGPREGWTALASDSRGRLLAAGSRAGGPHSEPQIFVARLRTPEALDPAFGERGTVEIDLPADASEPGGIAPLSDGKILVAGRSATYARDGIVVLRLTENGALDRSFGSAGVVRLRPLRFARPLTRGATTAVAVDASGRIVVAEVLAPARNATTGGALALIRLTPEGRLDRTFAGDGMATWSLDFPSTRVVRAGDRFLGRLLAYRAVRGRGFKHVRLGVLCEGTLAPSFACTRADRHGRLTEVLLTGSGKPRIARRQGCCVESRPAWHDAVPLSIGAEAYIRTTVGALYCTALRAELVCANRSNHGFLVSASRVRAW